MCSYAVMNIDEASAKEKSKPLYYAGNVIQGYWMYIVMRDVLITANHFIRGHQQAFAIVIVSHYFLSCLDNIFMTGIMIWATVALSSEEAKLYEEAPESERLQ